MSHAGLVYLWENKNCAVRLHILFQKRGYFFNPREPTCTIINYPSDGQPHKTVVMHLSSSRLRDYYAMDKRQSITPVSPKIFSYNKHPLLEGCLSSLIPYFELKVLPKEIASLKITEAVSILRTIDKTIDGVLANFEEPGKVDLVLSHFSYAFKKHYGYSPTSLMAGQNPW